MTSESQNAVRYAIGDQDDRPWGNWRVVDVGARFTTKRIEVKPGHRLSLQTHQHRSEYWVIVSGTGEATIGDERISVEPGHSLHIPCETKHRIHNTGDAALVFVEVQLGDLLDENDITRLEDDYSRIT